MTRAKRELQMDLEACAILSLLHTPGVGPAAVHRVLAAAAQLRIPVAELLDLTPRVLMDRLPAGLHEVSALVARCGPVARRETRDSIRRVKSGGGRVITLLDWRWPDSLRALGNAMPPLLFARGNIDLLERLGAGVVGAREPHHAGAELAEGCARFFACEGIMVISGGARGIDALAHMAALAAGGETLVVLPQGLLTYAPPQEISRASDEGRALVVSQFYPDAPWETHAAVTRNATISALARMVCVIDPRKTGGSIRTARVAIGQGKPVAAWCSTKAMRQLLEQAGAVPLAHDGGLDAEYLRELWCQSLREAPVQADLFHQKADA